MPDKKREGDIIEAENWLRLARERAKEGNIEEIVEHLREHASKAGVTLEEIGTSEEELKGLLTEGYTVRAKDWLRLARERAKEQEVEAEVEYLKKYASKAGITLEEIGTSEEELKELLAK